MGIIAQCGSCGFTWETQGLIGLGSGANVVLSNVTTNCPRCSGEARLLDGQWQGTQGNDVLVDGPPQSKAIYSAFRELVRQAKDGKLTPTEVQAKAAELNEGLGRAIALLIKRYPKTAVFVLSLVALLKVFNFETKIDVNDLFRQVVDIVETDSGALEKAARRDHDNTKERKPRNDSAPIEHGTTNKQDRIRYKPPKHAG